MKKVCVIGGGPAGMMAAYAAASRGYRVTLFEKNEKLGKKLYITGKGRCNITNAAPIEDFFDQVVSNAAFLYSSFYTFSNTQLIDWLSQLGLATKIERGGRVFPVSDKSSDVIKALQKALKSTGVRVLLGSNVQDICIEDGRIAGIVCGNETLNFDAVIIATGGLSYPSTGCTGDGYRFAKSAGHMETDMQPSLVGIDICEEVSILAGLSLKNIGLSIIQNGKKIYDQQGEMLFTHTGVSGPLVLSASAYMEDGKQYEIGIDLKPALDEKTLDRRILRDFSEKSNKDFSNVLAGLIPAKMISFIVDCTGIDAYKKAHSITKEERKVLLQALKGLRLRVAGRRPIEEAVITRGGIDVKEIDASTMQSKLCNGLYFAGEVIDIDAMTGGFNLQIAFSTGYLAGISC